LGPMRDEVTREWRKLHTEELNDLYCSQNIDQIEKNEIGGAGRAYGGEERWGYQRERDHWRDSGVDGKIILRWIFRK